MRSLPIREGLNTAGEDIKAMENAGQHVIDRARAALKLAFSKPVSEEEIAAQLCLSVGEVSHSLHIARQAIRTILSVNF